MAKLVDALPISTLIVASLALGLAPFVPMPHLAEKIGMLFRGELRQPIDVFDLFMHGAPVALLVAKLARTVQLKRRAQAS